MPTICKSPRRPLVPSRDAGARGRCDSLSAGQLVPCSGPSLEVALPFRARSTGSPGRLTDLAAFFGRQAAAALAVRDSRAKLPQDRGASGQLPGAKQSILCGRSAESKASKRPMERRSPPCRCKQATRRARSQRTRCLPWALARRLHQEQKAARARMRIISPLGQLSLCHRFDAGRA